MDWGSEAEMQRLLAILPDVQPMSETELNNNAKRINGVDFPSALDLELASGMEWDLEPGSAGIDVY
jgi:hypothetical protein